MIFIRDEDGKKGSMEAVEFIFSVDFLQSELNLSLFFDAYLYGASDLIKDELASLEVLFDLDSLITLIV